MTQFKSKDTVSFSSKPCRSINVNYLNGDDPFAISIQMSNTFLKDLRGFKEKNRHLSYVDIVNTQLQHFRVNQSVRVENRLNCKCSDVISKFRTKYKGGRKRYTFGEEIYTLTLFESELFKFTDNTEGIPNQFDNTNVEREIRCEEIWCSIENVQQGEPHRPDFDSLNCRQRRRRLDKITEKSRKALEFLDEYGLTPKVLKLVSPGQTEHTVSYDSHGFSDLPEKSKAKLRTVVTILDRFGVSEAAYHELSQVCRDLPRTHTVAKARSGMTSTLVIKRVPNGAMVHFREELKKKVLEAYKQNPDLNQVTVHLSADGTRVSRISTFVVFSFQLVHLGVNEKHSPIDLCTLAIVNCKEDYTSLSKSLKPLFDEINSVVNDGNIYVGDKKVDVHIVFCSDMKMTLTVMGLGKATSIYSCPWCLVHREDRHITSYPLDHYNSDTMRRTTDSNKQYADRLEYGVHHSPLLSIKVEDFVLDELHLLLRVTDVLLNNLMDEAQLRDETLRSEKKDPTHVNNLVQCIKSCGVSFSVWTVKDSGKLSWTSLSGLERKKLLDKLPSQLRGKIDSDNEEATSKLWTLFKTIHTDVSSVRPSSPENIFQMSKEWIETFLSQGPSFKENITPYIHCMLYHIPRMIAKFGSLRPFSCQVVEKTNDDIKKIYQRKANKWDPAVEVLKIRKRMEEHSGLTRKKRKYTKRNGKYWEEELQETRQKKRAKLRAETEASLSAYHPDNVDECENQT